MKGMSLAEYAINVHSEVKREIQPDDNARLNEI